MHKPEQATEDDPLATLYQHHASSILRYLDRRLSSKEDAEDLLLEVFLAALQQRVWTTLPGGDQLAWLHRVAHHKLVDHYRRAARHPVLALQDVQEVPDDDERRLPEELALQHERQVLLERSIAALPQLQQDVLRLRFAHGLPTRDIALRLQKTDTAVRILLSRTLNALRRVYYHHTGV